MKLVVFRCIVLASIQFISSSASAQQSWIQSPVNGHWYDDEIDINWWEGEALAVTYGGHLATIRSSEEAQWVRATLGAGRELMIGFRGLDWAWSSGEPIVYTAWAAGQPDTHISDFRYAHMPASWGGNNWYSQSGYGFNKAVAIELISDDCNSDGVPDTYEIFLLPALDTDSNGVIDTCEDCDSNGIPDGVDIQSGALQDCDSDGYPDQCAISDQPSLDCDTNGVLDSCDLAANPTLDCDNNGALDSCELAANAGLDFNLNGVLDVCECQATNYCIASGNSAGPPASMGYQGTFSLTNNDFVLTAASAPPFKFGMFFYASTQTQVFLGEGALCVGPTVQRLQPVVVTDQQGSVSLALDFTQPPFSAGSFAVTPFSTWNFQFWYRDPQGGPAGFNFSDGLEVTFCP